MEKNLLQFVKKHYSKIDNEYSHVSLNEPIGKFNITRRYTEEFWKKYQDAVQSTPDMVSCLAERPGYYFPVYNDTDIKIPYDEKKHNKLVPLYTQEQLKFVVETYQKVIREI